MENLAWEIIFIIIGIVIGISYLRKLNDMSGSMLRIFKIMYVSSLILNFLIVEILDRGAMMFGDGYDYYRQAQPIIDTSGFNLSTMLDLKKFIDIGQSWHFVPTWEFTLFMGLFSSTRCLALFHVLLTNLSAIVWVRFFKKIGMERSGLVAATILVGSFYVRNFTTPALKDALVYFLFTLISFFVEEFYLQKTYKSLIKIVIPLFILVFTRMYTAAAVVMAIGIIILGEVKKLLIGRISYKRAALLMLFLNLTVAAFIVLMRTEVYKYILSWIGKTGFGILLILDVLKRMINFLYGPFFINAFNAQNLYYPSYLSAFLRLLATPIFINGVLKMKRYKNRRCVYIILFVPFLVSLLALSVGEQQSAIRQYMNYYPLLCIIYGIGCCKYEKGKLLNTNGGVI